MADTEIVPENRLPRSMKKSKFKSVNEIMESDLFRIKDFNGWQPSPSSPQCLHLHPPMADIEIVSERIKDFNGGGHSVFERYGLHPSQMDFLKSFGQKLEEHKNELIGLLSSEKNDEKLRMILSHEEQEDRNFNLGTCISIIYWSISDINDMPELLPEEETKEIVLKQQELFQEKATTENDDPILTTEHSVLAGISAESESRGGIESYLNALIENLEEQMTSITKLIGFLEVDGSTKDKMGLEITRLHDLLKNETKIEKHAISRVREVGSR